MNRVQGRRISLLLLIGTAAAVLAVWLGPELLTRPSGNLSDRQRLEAMNDVRAVLVQLLVAAGFLSGLIFTALSVSQQKETQITERFTKAIDQLGSNEEAVRTGAVYALERLAKDSPRDHPAIVDILASFIRLRAPITGLNDYRDKDSLPERAEDVQAAVTVLARRERRPDERVINLRATDLRRVRMRAGNFSHAYLRGTVLQWADLGKVSMIGADLHESMAQAAWLRAADLTEADLRTADFSDAKFFDQYRPSRASLARTKLVKTNFTGADLRCVDLRGADLTGTILCGADLRGALVDGTGLTDKQLAQARTRPEESVGCQS